LPVDGVLTDAGPRNLTGLDTLEGRISAWCAWFGLEAPRLKRNRKREVLFTDEFLAWVHGSDGSLDWFVCGDVRAMAVAYRKSERTVRRFQDVLKRLDDTEQRLLLDAMTSSQEHGAPLEEALEDCRKAVEAHRAAKATQIERGM
jgi:hypothetical protein